MKKQIVSLVLTACLFSIFPLSAAATADDVYFTEPRSTTAFRDEFLTFAKAHAIEHGYYYEPVFGENSYYYEELYHHYSGGSIDWALIKAQYALQEPHFIRTWIRLCNKTFDGDLMRAPFETRYCIYDVKQKTFIGLENLVDKHQEYEDLTEAIKRLNIGALTGDANLDGKLDISDVTKMQRIAAEYGREPDFDDDFYGVLDVNGNHRIDVNDVTSIQRYLAEFTTEIE